MLCSEYNLCTLQGTGFITHTPRAGQQQPTGPLRLRRQPRAKPRVSFLRARGRTRNRPVRRLLRQRGPQRSGPPQAEAAAGKGKQPAAGASLPPPRRAVRRPAAAVVAPAGGTTGPAASAASSAQRDTTITTPEGREKRVGAAASCCMQAVRGKTHLLCNAALSEEALLLLLPARGAGDESIIAGATTCLRSASLRLTKRKRPSRLPASLSSAAIQRIPTADFGFSRVWPKGEKVARRLAAALPFASLITRILLSGVCALSYLSGAHAALAPPQSVAFDELSLGLSALTKHIKTGITV